MRNFLANLRIRISRFMYGRNGVDAYARFLMYTGLGIVVVTSLLSGLGFLMRVIQWLGLGMMLYAYFRIFSKNLERRQSENHAFLTAKKAGQNSVSTRMMQLRQGKDYRFFKCPKCSVTTRVPRGKGKIRIKCPKCGTEFIRKS